MSTHASDPDYNIPQVHLTNHKLFAMIHDP